MSGHYPPGNAEDRFALSRDTFLAALDAWLLNPGVGADQRAETARSVAMIILKRARLSRVEHDIRRMWFEGVSYREMGRRLAIHQSTVFLYVQIMGLPPRQPARRPTPVWSEERRAILREHVPAGTPSAEILRMVNALPGPKVDGTAVSHKTGHMKLYRPEGFNGARRRPVARAVVTFVPPKPPDPPKPVLAPRAVPTGRPFSMLGGRMR